MKYFFSLTLENNASPETYQQTSLRAGRKCTQKPNDKATKKGSCPTKAATALATGKKRISLVLQTDMTVQPLFRGVITSSAHYITKLHTCVFGNALRRYGDVILRGRGVRAAVLLRAIAWIIQWTAEYLKLALGLLQKCTLCGWQ